jgi:hypothetical protein
VRGTSFFGCDYLKKYRDIQIAKTCWASAVEFDSLPVPGAFVVHGTVKNT